MKKTGRGGRADAGCRFLAGSYTVEAAFVIPVILGLFFAWIFQLFCLHDRVVIHGMLQEAAVCREERSYSGQDTGGAEENEVCGEGQAAVDDEEGDTVGQHRDRIQSHLWLMEITSLQVRRGIAGERYALTSEASWDIPVMRQFLKNHFAYSHSVETGSLRPETDLRLRGKGEKSS